MRGIALLVFVACFFAVAGIAVWRFAAPRPPAPEVVGGIKPASVSVSGGWTEIKYKNVPAQFVPPLPDFAATPPPISIDIETDAEGALIRVSALYLRPDTPGSVMLSDFPPAEQDVIAADYAALRETVVMRCLYRKGAAAEVYHYWHRGTPESARRERLKARHREHPLLQVHEGRLTCPATARTPVAAPDPFYEKRPMVAERPLLVHFQRGEYERRGVRAEGQIVTGGLCQATWLISAYAEPLANLPLQDSRSDPGRYRHHSGRVPVGCRYGAA